MSDSSIKNSIGFLLTAAGQMYWEVDRNFTVTFANDLLKEIFGDPTGKKCYESFCRKSQVCRECPVAQVINGAKSAQSEEIRYDKNNMPIWLDNTATPVKNDNGEIIGASQLSVDITQKKRDLMWLKDSERLYRNLVEQSPDVIFSLDPQGNFTFVNTQVEKFLGYSVSHVLETPLKDYVAPEDRSRLYGISELNPESIWDEEVAVIDSDGARKYARIRIKLSFGETGVSLGFDGVMRDRTIRRKLEEELKSSKAALVEKIKIIDELYEHIVESGKCKAIEDHTAEVAHELRQPLAIVGGFARRLSKALEGDVNIDIDRQKQYVHIIISEIHRLEKILDRLIEFTKRDHITFQKVNPNELIKYIIGITESRITEKNISLNVNLGPEIGDIPLDPGRFQQLALNLLSNAIDASPRGGSIDLETGISIPSDKALKIGALEAETFFEMKIRNNGPIIPPETLQNVFNPFFTTKEHGTGLGLTVSKKIVEDHGGSISVKSDGDGTIFTIWFPVNEISNGRRDFCLFQAHS
ncbi:MAG: PAS domain S-box protein [Deltaproteobacteria bacterium]|nr:PAS domain S-box protein [Deltaproteobacteria bacterium]